MDKQDDALQVLKTYGEASAVLNPLIASVQLLGLLRGALKCGILSVTRTLRTPTQIAAAVGLPEDLVVNFCRAFDAHGVFVRENGAYRLEDRWAILVDQEMPTSLQDSINYAFAQSEALEHIGTQETDYWDVKSADRLALAKGVTLDPASPHTSGAFRAIIQECAPEVHARMSTGCRYLELGCGVGGFLVGLLQAYPDMIAVGVELAADLREEAQRRAVTCGVSDRVRLHHGDASCFMESEAFDFVFWSQFFFPVASRAGTLQAAFNALKPGGFLMAPLQPEPSILDTDLHSEQGKAYALHRVRYGAWGIPAVGAQDLQHEMEKAGFVSTRLGVTPMNRVIVAERP